MKIALEPFSAEAFAPFGASFQLPREAGARIGWSSELANLRANAAAKLEATFVAAASLPRMLPKMERHSHSSQSFIPMGGVDYMVVVAPARTDADAPDVAGLRAFRTPGDVAITYGAGVWHAPIATIGAPQAFAMMIHLAHDGRDETWFDLPEAVEIHV